jgi:hypothetical protein
MPKSISTTGRTKFVIKGTALKTGDVLIRSDTVTIEVAARASGSELYVSQVEGTGNNLVLSSVSKNWTFKDLFESFGVEYSTGTTGTATNPRKLPTVLENQWVTDLLKQRLSTPPEAPLFGIWCRFKGAFLRR